MFLQTAMKETQLSGKQKILHSLLNFIIRLLITKAEKWFLLLWENEDGAVLIVKQSHIVFPDVGSSLKKGSIYIYIYIYIYSMLSQHAIQISLCG